MALPLRVICKTLLLCQDWWLRSGRGLTLRGHTTLSVEREHIKSRPTAKRFTAG
jgi:hypothetical protein